MGWEAFYQCVTLAAALQRRRRPTHFLTSFAPVTLANAILKAGNEYALADAPLGSADDARQVVREIERLGAAGVIVAGPNLSEDYLAQLRDTGAMVTVIDSRAATRLPAHLIINPLLAPGLKSYQTVLGAQLVLGRRYALIRSLFRRQRPLRATEPSQPFRCFLAFGDDDAQGQTLIRAKELLGITRIDKIYAAVRLHHPQWNELKELAATHAGRLEVISEPGEISTRMMRSHFALSSGDGWSLELACVGIPQLLLPQTAHHLANAQRLDDEGAATLVGEAATVSPGELRNAIQVVLNDPMERLGMSRCSRHLIDGRGPDRMVLAIELMLRANAAAKVQPRLRLVA